MRIHRLDIENINSLYGQHSVDFDRGLQGASLFLIHGPTGAGKSTLLDSIALALYGRTARLPSAVSTAVDEAGHEDPRQVISRGQGHASVSMVFSQEPVTGGPRRVFRAVWRAGRAHKRPDGRLQAPVRELFRLENPQDSAGEQLVGGTKSTDHDAAFDTALCGMDFASFERMMMLPQGQFAEFLKSNETTKAKLLKSMLRDDIEAFSAIGQRINEAKLAADATLKELAAAIRALTDSQSSNDDTESVDLLREKLATVLERGQAQKAQLESLQHKKQLLAGYLGAQLELQRAKTRIVDATRALNEAQPELQRLKEHESGQGVRMLLAKLDPIVDGIADVEKSIARTQTELEELSKSHAEKQATAQPLEIGYAAALNAQKLAAPAVVQARSLDESIRGLKKALVDIAGQTSTQTQSADDEQKRHDESRLALDEAAKELEGKTTTLAAMPEAERLSAVAAALDSALEQERNAADTEQTCTHESKAAQRAFEELSERQQKDAAKLEQASGDMQALDQRITELQLALAPVIEDDDSSPESLRKVISERSRSLSSKTEKFATLAAQLQEIQTELAGLVALIAAESAETLSLQTEAERLKSMVEKEERVLTEHRATLRHFDQLFGMVEQLEALRSDPEAACALCGSHSHDPAHIESLALQFAEHEQTQARLMQAVESAEQKYDEQRRDLSALQEKVREHQREATERASKKETLTENSETIIRSSNLEIHTLAALQNAASEAHARLMAWSTSVPELSKHVDELQNAHTRREAAMALQSTLQAELQESVAQMDTLQTQTVQAQTRAAEAGAALQLKRDARAQAQADAQSLIPATGIESLTSATSLLTELRGMITAHATHTVAVEQLARRRDMLVASIGSSETRLKQAQAALELLRARHSEANGDLARLTLERGELLDGQAVDDFVRQLEAKVTEARTARDELTEALTRTAADIGALNARRTAQHEQLAQLKTQEHAAREQVAQALGESTFDSLEQLRTCTLPEDVAGSLHQRRESLNGALATAQAQAADRTTTVSSQSAAVTEAFPEQSGMPERSTEDLETLLALVADEVIEAETAKDATGHEWSQLNARIKDRERLDVQLNRLHAERSALSERASRLQQLDRLIGGKDGKNFELRALALMLDRLLVTANDWLSTFSPRYRLQTASGADGIPVLDFVVQDMHHAGTQRPVTTLSGGETFMVSLALALALSGSRNMPYRIETLLIDEGFGTLDQDSLRIVMSTLEALQERNGNTVGIISHVAGLSEQIPAQIRVTTAGNGRSAVEAGVYSGLSGVGRV
jgi:exonuclease SbcC